MDATSSLPSLAHENSIPDVQIKSLRGLGKWLDIYGEAIFDTRPWHLAEGKIDEDLQVRFTQSGDTLYVTLLGTPSGELLTLTDFNPGEGSDALWLATSEPLHWSLDNDACEIQLPGFREDSPAHVIKFTQ